MKINYRNPVLRDGLSIYELIKSCPPLDVNSIYYYYLMCRDFEKTCVVGHDNSQIISFLSAYYRPQEPDCLFIWQIAVDKRFRGHKAAFHMLTWLLEQPYCSHIRVLEATVSPSNQASQALLRSFALHRQAECEKSPFLDSSCFGNEEHEEEVLFRIFPVNK